MDYPELCKLLDQLKTHLASGQELSMEDLLEKAKHHERWRNMAALYSLRTPENFFTLLKKSNNDPDVRRCCTIYMLL